MSSLQPKDLALVAAGAVAVGAGVLLGSMLSRPAAVPIVPSPAAAATARAPSSSGVPGGGGSSSAPLHATVPAPAPAQTASKATPLQDLETRKGDPCGFIFKGFVAERESVGRDRDTFFVPARIKSSAGLLRTYEFRPNAPNGRQTIAGVRVARHTHGEEPGAFNGVLMAVYSDIETWTASGPLRQIRFVKKPISDFELISWQGLPEWVTHVYVMTHTDQYMIPADKDYPVLQTYLDTIYKCNMSYGEDFAREWFQTTRGFPAYWLNDREIPRRPWLKCKFYKDVDKMLGCDRAEVGKNGFTHRKLPEEYSAAAGIDLMEMATAEASAEESKQQRTSAAWAPPRSAASDCVNESTARQVADWTGKKLPAAATENFVFGFGSLINTASRMSSDPQAVDAVPVRILADVGYARAWNFQSGTASITALGLEKTTDDNARTINGILSPVFSSFEELDEREAGYQRVAVPQEQLQTTSWVQLPLGGKVWVYVPKLEGEDEPGVGLHMASYSHPILQTYVDVCLLGCLEQSVESAKEFITSTGGWDGPWLNDREIARRPWLKQSEYKRIDSLLRDTIPVETEGRMLPEEMGAKMAAMIEEQRSATRRTCSIARRWAAQAGVKTDLERHHHHEGKPRQPHEEEQDQ